MATAVFALGIVLFSASLFTAVFRRTQVPDVLSLILLGILAGPVFGLIGVDDFGKVGGVMSSVALVVILFESGMSLELQALTRSIQATSVVTLVTFVATMAVVAVVSHMGLGLPWLLACAMGAMLGGTSSAVVIPMVRQLPIGTVPATVLILESALTDVLSIIVAMAFINAVSQGTLAPMAIAGGILASLILAALIGVLAAMVFLFFVNALRAMPNAVLSLLAYVFVTYGITEMMGFSGAIAALALGFTLTNRAGLGITKLRWFAHVAEVKTPRYVQAFLADAIFMLKTFFFVYLGLSIHFGSLPFVLWAALAMGVVYAARAVIVRYTAPSGTPLADANVMAVMVPKGLAAAVLASVPLHRGFPEGAAMQQFTYMAVLISIVLTSVLVPIVQRGVPRLAPSDDE